MTDRAKKAQEKLQELRKDKMVDDKQPVPVQNVQIKNAAEWGNLWK